jgi:hypothetical protein
MHFIACLLLAAQDPVLPIEVPAEVKGQPGSFVTITAKTTGKTVKWVPLDPGLNLFPVDLLKDTHTAVATAPLAGEYRVMAYTAIDGEPTGPVICKVILGNPKPPEPPKPPVPPVPTDPLAKALQAAYDGDKAATATKNGQRILLVGLYEAMADHAKNMAIKTAGDLLKDLRDVGGQMIAPGALIECRKLISGEVSTILGTNPAAALDPDLRPKAIDVFTRISKALAEVR